MPNYSISNFLLASAICSFFTVYSQNAVSDGNFSKKLKDTAAPEWQNSSRWIYNSLVAKFADAQENYSNAIIAIDGIAEASKQYGAFAYNFDLEMSVEHFQRAVEIAKQWVNSYPDDATARENLIHALLANKDEHSAFAEMQELLNRDSSVQVVAQIANLIPFLPDENRRIVLLKQLCNNFPDNPFLYYYLGITAREIGQIEVAVEAFEDALMLEKNWRQVEILLVQALAGIGEINRAREILAKLRKDHPDEASLWAIESEILLKNNLWTEAEKFLELWQKTRPNDANIKRDAAKIYSSAGNVVKAEEIYRQMRDRGDISSDTYLFLIAQGYSNGKNKKEAIKTLEKISSESRNFLPAQQQIASLSLEVFGMKKAQEIFQKIRRDFPDYALEIYLIEIAQLERIKPAAADKIIQEAKRNFPDNTEILYAEAEHLSRMEKITEAEKIYQQILLQDEANIDALNAYGYLLLQQKNRYQEAKKLIEQAVKKYPESPAIQDSYALLLLKEDKKEQALIWAQRAYAVYRSDEICAHYLEILAANDKKERAKEVFNSIKQAQKAMPKSLAIGKKLDL
ncbi:MAG: tetratricopeptide repeat protein [Cardiobacteriaceae bacterium]|nr:tetratricopeptide repeat protein [Cardiobacteriaceae bacterium]